MMMFSSLKGGIVSDYEEVYGRVINVEVNGRESQPKLSMCKSVQFVNQQRKARQLVVSRWSCDRETEYTTRTVVTILEMIITF